MELLWEGSHMFVSDNRVISVMPCVDLCFPTKIMHFCHEPEVQVNHLKVPGLIFTPSLAVLSVLRGPVVHRGIYHSSWWTPFSLYLWILPWGKGSPFYTKPCCIERATRASCTQRYTITLLPHNSKQALYCLHFLRIVQGLDIQTHLACTERKHF